MTTRDTLKILCDAAGVNGQRAATEAAVQLLQPLADEVHIDALGSVLAVRRCAQADAPTVLLEAHIDQIGFVVTQTDSKGFVRVNKCGGIDRRTLPAAEVIVWGDRPYPGVFCSVPPHLAKDKSVPEIADLGIDVGLTAEEAASAIHAGDRVTFRPRFDDIGTNRVCSPALDNRAGCAAVLHALTRLSGQTLSCHVAVALATREEVGGHSAAAAAFGLMPTKALATDVSFALTPDADPAACGRLGGGVMLGYSPLLDRDMTQTLATLAEEQQIPCQPEVMGSRTGTDADCITVTGTGIPTALLSIPLRYMHTPVELVDLRDVENTGALMAAFISRGGN